MKGEDQLGCVSGCLLLEDHLQGGNTYLQVSTQNDTTIHGKRLCEDRQLLVDLDYVLERATA